MMENLYSKNKISRKKILFGIAVFVTAFAISCRQSSPPGRTNIRGSWKSLDGKTKLKITEKEFVLDEDGRPIAENYFVKGDTIFTSYEGSQPYTEFGIKEVSGKTLILIYPDSTAVRFVR